MRGLASHPRWLIAAGVFATVFGIATVAAGGRALFGPAEARAAFGRVVPFVLWFNFLAGFAYVVAGAGLVAARRWAAALAAVIAAATALVFAGFGLHVLLGGAFEPRTVAALAFRTVSWAGLAVAAWRHLGSRGGARGHPEAS